MSPFEKHHQLTPHQHVQAVNAEWRLRSRIRNIRRIYRQSLVMRAAFENLATGAYTPHQYVDGFDETFNPDHWMTADAGCPHRVVFTFAPLPPPADCVMSRV